VPELVCPVTTQDTGLAPDVTAVAVLRIICSAVEVVSVVAVKVVVLTKLVHSACRAGAPALKLRPVTVMYLS